MELDALDHDLLDLLREDARRTLADLGTELSLSPGAVRRRMARLEENGVVQGYTVVVDESRVAGAIEAFVELRFAGVTKVGDIDAMCRSIESVQEVFTTAGDPDALVRVRVDDMAHLRTTIDRIRRSGKVTGTKTLMVLNAWQRGR